MKVGKYNLRYSTVRQMYLDFAENGLSKMSARKKVEKTVSSRFCMMQRREDVSYDWFACAFGLKPNRAISVHFTNQLTDIDKNLERTSIKSRIRALFLNQ